jgi:Tat protein translocase TatB subunit
MFGIGLPELFIILIIALVVLGPDKLPDLARAIGKGIGEFRRATDEIKQSFNSDDELRELKTSLTQAKNEMTDLVRRETANLDTDAIAKAFTEGQGVAEDQTIDQAEQGEAETAVTEAVADQAADPGEATDPEEDSSAGLAEKDKPST